MGHVAQSIADLIDHPTHPIAGSAPRRAEVHDGRTGAGQAQIGGVWGARLGAFSRFRMNYPDIA